jgi:hypothetical protein
MLTSSRNAKYQIHLVDIVRTIPVGMVEKAERDSAFTRQNGLLSLIAVLIVANGGGISNLEVIPDCPNVMVRQ